MAQIDAPASAADLPSLDRLLREPAMAALLRCHGRQRVLKWLRTDLRHLRLRALEGRLSRSTLLTDAIVMRARQALQAQDRERLRAVYNLTGTILHSNLGRAPLPAAALEAVRMTMTCAVDLEFDLDAGRRGSREARACASLCELTGAEAATVVNNNAAAVLLLLNTLADGRQTIVSRGELVEIGGAFRIPDVMRSAGTRLVEVGTTNRTHPADFIDAIGPQTALLMQVHASNYAITGFTAAVDTRRLAALAHAHALPLAVDLGSGSLIDLAALGLPHEPTVEQTLRAGADLVTFSGDKLLGGPQAGLIVGRRELIARIDRNPLKRALRCDKMRLAALEAVLALYREPEFLAERLPVLRLLSRCDDAILAQARRLLPPIQAALTPDWNLDAVPMYSQTGSGAQPLERLPSAGLCIRHALGGRHGGDLKRLSARLRQLPRPVLGRIGDDALWLDLRTLEDADEAEFLAQWAHLAEDDGGCG